MKINRLILSIFLIVTVILFTLRRVQKAERPDSSASSPSPTIHSSSNSILSTTDNSSLAAIDLLHQGRTIRVTVQQIPKSSLLTLIPNFEKKASATSIVEEHRCKLAINGGFYQENGKPLGLFAIGRKTYGKEIESTLVNGFFWQTKEGKRDIGLQTPSDQNLDFIFQTGPLFYLPRKEVVKIIDDKPARRSLLGQDKEGNLFILVMYGPKDQFFGPELSQVPILASSHGVREVVQLTAILNLDGGSASFFYVKDGEKEFTLSELTPIGSLLCVR